jgi:capsule polysaccharide export protein KpsE/RkpR
MPSLLSVIVRHKRLILLVTAAGFVISSIVSLVLPSRYIASTMFAPVGVEQDITSLRSFFAPLGSFGESFAAYLRARKNYLIDTFVRSRRMSDIIDARFDLRSMYHVSDLEKARGRLREHTGVLIKDEGVIVLTFEDHDRDRALAVTQEYVAELDSILIDLTVESSEDQIAFLKGEIARRQRAIHSTDSLLQDYLGHYGLYEMQQQVRAMLDIVSDLSSRLSVLDVEKKLLELTMKPGSPELDKVEFEYRKLREQLLLLRERGAEPGLFPPIKQLPSISTRYLQLMTERKTQEFILAYLRVKLADAQVSADSRVSVLKVLDPPAVPERRSWPRRKQIVMISTAAAFFWSCYAVIVSERLARRRSGEASGETEEAPGDACDGAEHEGG